MFEDSIFWDAMACRLVSVCRCFKATTFLQMSADTYQTTQRHVFDDPNPHTPL
jgi:hypothetical protein